jgi:hypothetical protein
MFMDVPQKMDGATASKTRRAVATAGAFFRLESMI